MDARDIRQSEDRFYGKIDDAIGRIKDPGCIDMVVGIPFYNEKETLAGVIKTAAEGLAAFPDRKKLIVCVGDPAGQEALESAEDIDCGIPCVSFLMEQGINGRGFSIRAVLEIAKRLEADAVLLEADLKGEGEWGLKPSWIERMIRPLDEGYDMVLANFRRHYFEDTTGDLFVKPVLEALYGCRLKDPLSGVYAFSHDMVERYCTDVNQWYEYAGGYGADPWLVTKAVVWGSGICEVSLGAKITIPSAGKRAFVFKEAARAVFECLGNDQDFWLKSGMIFKRPALYGLEDRDRRMDISCRLTDFVQSFQSGYESYKAVYDKLLPEDIKAETDEIYGLPNRDFRFDERLWARLIYLFLLTYSLNKDMSKDDLLDAFTVMYEGRTAGYIRQVKGYRSIFVNVRGADMDGITYKKADDYYARQVEELLSGREELIEAWNKKNTETKPAITPLDYLEFVPGVPVVLPKQLTGLGGSVINTNGIFRRLVRRYREEFHKFNRDVPGIPGDASPDEVGRLMEAFMHSLEEAAARVLEGDLYSADGVSRLAEGILDLVPHEKTVAVKDEVLRKLLYEFPPMDLMIRMDFGGVTEMLHNISPRCALTLASLIEERQYMDEVMLWLEDNLRPDSIEEADLDIIILNRGNIPDITDMKQITVLNRVTGMIAVRCLSKGMGGEYPRLRYLTHMVKCVAEQEHYSFLWKLYARERRGFGLKAINSVRGHHGREAFSAHNMFENWHQRDAAAKFKRISEKLDSMGKAEEARLIYGMAEGYGLSLTLNDDTFVSCTAWTWASYSFRGGKGLPTPLSAHVDRDWFNYDLLEEIYKEMGYRIDEIPEEICQLLGEGKEGVNLVSVLLGVNVHRDAVMVQDVEKWPQAGPLVRYGGNPLLKPVPGHWWECRYVLNSAAFRIEDRIYLLYRAFGKDGISRIGLAVSDGYNIVERLPDPVFSPGSDREKEGCEDPRVVILDGKIYMMYTSYDGVVAQVAAACIGVGDFLQRDFDRWERLGLAFPNLWDKDAILFPEKINGQYVMYHRIEPSMWVTYSDRLTFPWPREGHKIIIGPRSGMMWDSFKIGAGSQPLKTMYGWLLIYHGVDDNMIYRLGVILTDLKDPGRLLYRSPNPILSPEMEYETGDRVSSWVPNVVFTCGAVPEQNKEVLDADDGILVYYGAADTYLCVAHAKVGDLLPQKIREKMKR